MNYLQLFWSILSQIGKLFEACIPICNFKKCNLCWKHMKLEWFLIMLSYQVHVKYVNHKDKDKDNKLRFEANFYFTCQHYTWHTINLFLLLYRIAQDTRNNNVVF